MTLEELVVRIRVVTDGMESGLDAAIGSLQTFAKTAQKTTEDSAKAQAEAWKDLSAAAGDAFGKIMQAMQSGAEANNAYTFAMEKLDRAAAAHGVGQEQMRQALDTVTDEFLSATDAATAYENLLARGYSLDQATQTIHNLKNAAAYGRQANVSLAQAVVSATQGILSENSALVANAGVTKSVTAMWQDYAAARGLAADSLTQAQKAEAEYLGIMQATSAQMGDLETLSSGMIGAQAEAASQNERLLRAFGEAMSPAAMAGTERAQHKTAPAKRRGRWRLDRERMAWGVRAGWALAWGA